jgi:hypothetical protein
MRDTQTIPKFAIGETVWWEDRYWWCGLWQYPYFQRGVIKRRQFSFVWMYEVEGCTKWCTEGYLLDNNPRTESDVIV